MEINDLLEPTKVYKHSLKDAFHKNAEDYFEELRKTSNIDVGANKVTCDEIRANEIKASAINKKANGKKGLMTLFIILGVIAVLGGIILMTVGFNISNNKGLLIGGGIAALLLGLVAIILPIVLIRPKIKAFEEQIRKLNEKIEQLKKEAYAQMAALNSLYDWGIPATLVSKTVPLIQMDKTFEPKRFYQLNSKYGFGENNNKDVSTTYVQSGSILGNPFLIERNFVKEMVPYTYTGSIVITWTTTYRDKNGTHTQVHTQTLTASVTKPKPEYFHDTWLVYGNDAAEHLSFTRQPSNASSLNENEMRKTAQKFEKELQKMHEKNINKNNFTPLANSEFEAFFHALDRDNEVEFRLLFTPLAQKNMLDLIESKEPYGDDFIFEKHKCLNYIKSRHAQNADYDGDPRKFIHYDYEVAKAYFVSYMDKYFQSFFYALAPLLSIPLYQQHKDVNFIYKDVYDRNVTSFESEVMANRFDPQQFAPANNKTDIILKASLIKKEGKSDIVNITAYGHDKIMHVDYIPKLGGDGRTHSVPVTWYEYVPLKKETPMQIQNVPYSKKDQTFMENMAKAATLIAPFAMGNDIITQRGIFSSILKNNKNTWNGDELNKIFSQKED